MDSFQNRLYTRKGEILDTKEYMTQEEHKPILESCTRRIWQRLKDKGLVMKETWGIFENFVKDMGLAPQVDSGLTIRRTFSKEPVSEVNCRWVLLNPPLSQRSCRF